MPVDADLALKALNYSVENSALTPKKKHLLLKYTFFTAARKQYLNFFYFEFGNHKFML